MIFCRCEEKTDTMKTENVIRKQSFFVSSLFYTVNLVNFCLLLGFADNLLQKVWSQIRPKKNQAQQNVSPDLDSNTDHIPERIF